MPHERSASQDVGQVSTSRVRVAMIGAGGLATKVHYPSLASLHNVEMAAVCDTDPERLANAVTRFGIKRTFTDYRRMIEDIEPDAVYAIGPPDVIYPVWVWCLQQGLNLFIEKPMGLTMHQATILAHLAEMHGCTTQVGFQRRTSPLLVKMREECLHRGPIVHAVCRFYKCEPSPYLNSRDHMMDDCVHSIDTLRWLCGGEIRSLESLTRCNGTPDINVITALLQFGSGATGVLMNNWSSGRRIFSVEMHATGVCAEANPESFAMLYADGDTDGVRFATDEVAGSSDLHVYAGYLGKNREFIDAVRGGPQPGSCFADAVKTMKIAEQILAQSVLREE